jgi:hypothetical protein
VSEPTLRAVLYAVAAFHLGLGLLMAISPDTFFDEVGPYGIQNDHYIGDVAAFYLAAGAGVLVSARRPGWREPLLVVGAIWYGLHALNHLVDIEEASSDAKGIFDTIALAIGALGSLYLARASARLARA